MKWIITVGGGYGPFEFTGTEEAAEAMRKHKARREGAPAAKKLAPITYKHTHSSGPKSSHRCAHSGSSSQSQ